MSILNIQTTQTGETGVLPSYASILTNDPESTVLTAGYLNQAVQNGASFALPCIAKIATKASSTADYQVGWYQIVHVGSNWNVVPGGNPGDVTLPTIANHIATYTNTTGTLSEDPATAISAGNIQAGLTTGTAGTLISCPSASGKGTLILSALANTGNTNTTIRNAAMGQASVISIPDPGAATANFILSAGLSVQTISTTLQIIGAHDIQTTGGNVIAGSPAVAGEFISYPSTIGRGTLILEATNNSGNFNVSITNASHAQDSIYSIPDSGAASANFIISAKSGIQHITSGSLEVDAGGLIAGIATGGTSGSLTLYPATAANGSLVLSPVGNAGNFAATISNVTGLGQASVYTLPDPGNAVARILVGATATPFTTGHLLSSSGTGGLIADSAIATTNVQLKTDVKAATTANIGGAGAGPISVAVSGLTTSSIVVANIATSSNAVSVIKCIATNTGFDITFSADPGATCTVNYVAYLVSQ